MATNFLFADKIFGTLSSSKNSAVHCLFTFSGVEFVQNQLTGMQASKSASLCFDQIPQMASHTNDELSIRLGKLFN